MFPAQSSQECANRVDLCKQMFSEQQTLLTCIHCKILPLRPSKMKETKFNLFFSSETTPEVLRKLEEIRRNDDLRLLPISANSVLIDSISSLPTS